MITLITILGIVTALVALALFAVLRAGRDITETLSEILTDEEDEP